MSRALDDLDARFRPVVFELLARSLEAGIPLKVCDTLRTVSEQQAAVLAGSSKTLHSLHLPQDPDGKALAIDVCPFLVFDLHGPDKLQWDTKSPAAVKVWRTLGAIGEGLGLRWGGRFGEDVAKGTLGWDAGHFEFVISKTGGVS